MSHCRNRLVRDLGFDCRWSPHMSAYDRIDTAKICQNLIVTKDTARFSTAPTVLTMIAGAEQDRARRLTPDPVRHRAEPADFAAVPDVASPARVRRGTGFDVTHLYRLAETFRPITIEDDDNRRWRHDSTTVGGQGQAPSSAGGCLPTLIAEPII